MRATFSADMPTGSDKNYPKDEELISFFASFGWELKDPNPNDRTQHTEATLNDKIKQYQEHTSKYIDNMPETESDEINYVIFFGAYNKVPFFVSQQTPKQITFRLISDDLARLQSTTENLIKQLIERRILGKRLIISNNEVTIYEPYCSNQMSAIGSNSNIPPKAKPMIFGKIIPNVLGETIKRGRKDLVVALFSLTMFVAVYETEVLGLFNLTSVKSIFNELYIVIFTTLAVSLFGLGQTYLETFLEIKYNHKIVWENSERNKLD